MSLFLQQLINGLAWGSIYALIALGYTMVYGVLRLINFAHGEVYMMGAMAGYYLTRALGFTDPSLLHFSIVLLSSMLCCALLGASIEKLAYKPLRSAPRISSLITAIGVSLLLQNGGQLIFGADPKFFPELLSQTVLFQWKEVRLSSIQLLIFGVSLFLMFLLHFIVMKTKVGKAMRAVSFSHTAAAFVGIPVNRIIRWTFVLGSALAGAAGVLASMYNPKIDPLMGMMPGLKAFVAAVLGGIGNIPGALLGGFVMGLSETFVSGYLSSTYRDAIAFVLLILILLFKPEGLLGKKSQEKV
ncbi:MAG: branched-chain amino acid ABC transporter permease [Deltaproteobacteria bacterium]|nr:branched-chain amino acid ABC transporter permease [Deltaproteobacteria bacterium]